MTSSVEPLVVGLAGGSASGKTTLARALANRLGPHRAVLLSHDRYYRNPPPDFDERTYNFDEPSALETSLMAEHLRALREGRPTEVPVYDFSNHQRSGFELLHPRPVVLVEGILIFCEAELRACMHHRIFVQTDEAIRLHRRLVRDQRDRGRTQMQILDQYFQTVRPMHEIHVEPTIKHATTVVDGTAPLEELSRHILRLLDGRTTP